MVGLRERVQRHAEATWGAVDLSDLDGTYVPWAAGMVGVVKAAQRDGVRLSGAYLSAFLASELGHRVRTPTLNANPYVGVSRDGRLLVQALASPLIGIKAAIKEGTPEPLKVGLERAVRMVGLDTDEATRRSLSDAMAENPQIAGWKRAVRGTCGACLALADERTAPPGETLHIHPNCQCVSEPVVKNVSDIFPRPSGSAIFKAMTKAAQDAALGASTAAQVRAGEVELAALAGTSALATQPDFITQQSPKQGGRNG